MSDPLDSRASAIRLHALAGAGLLDEAALAAGLARIGRRPAAEGWYRFARTHLILLGTVLVVVGAIFFIAANWDLFPPPVRIGLAAAVMAGATLAGGWIGLDRLTGRAAALAGGLLFGPLMALVGQIYQTGADAWELFFAWSLVLVAYALAIRFQGAWITALVLAVVTTYLWLAQALGGDPSESPGLWVSLGLSLALTALGLVRHLRYRGPDPDRLGAAAYTLAWFITFGHGAMALVVKGWPFGHVVALAWSIGQPFLLLRVATGVAPDIGLARAASAHLLGLLAVAEGKFIFDHLRAGEGGLLLMGLLLIAQGYLGGGWMLRRHRAAEGEP